MDRNKSWKDAIYRQNVYFSCLNQCTYCKTKHARGELGSYPPEEIVARAKQSFEGKYSKTRASDFFFQDWGAEVTHGAKNGGSFSEMMGLSISN